VDQYEGKRIRFCEYLLLDEISMACIPNVEKVRGIKQAFKLLRPNIILYRPDPGCGKDFFNCHSRSKKKARKLCS